MPFTSPHKRSHIMRSIPSEKTKPELAVKNILDCIELSYITNYKELEGKPDFYLSKYNAIIFVNGCFWHGHNCHMFRAPNPKSEYWNNKIKKNISRDALVIHKLSNLGYKSLVIWECALMGKMKIKKEILCETIEEWLLFMTDNCEIDFQGIKKGK